jgi:hypothetical protein
LLQTEILPQKASRRRSNENWVKSSGYAWIRIGTFNPESKLNRIGDALFIAEVGQNNKDAINPLPVLIKERRTLFRILPSLDATEFRRLLVKNNGFDTALREHLQDIVTPLSD